MRAWSFLRRFFALRPPRDRHYGGSRNPIYGRLKITPVFMNTASVDDPIVIKTRELCQTIVDQPEFASITSRVAAFMADEEAMSQYQSLSEATEHLNHKQEQGVELSDEEIDAYNQRRDEFFGNQTAKGFMDAQDEMNAIQSSVGKYVSKAFELGRTPSPDDLDGEGCGSGCGCHH